MYVAGVFFLVAGVNGLQMFGLSHAVIVHLLEQLKGATYCRNYHFEYFTHVHQDGDEVGQYQNQQLHVDNIRTSSFMLTISEPAASC